MLKNNNFQFNGDNYLQIGGTAIGTTLASSSANLFMRNLEEKILNEQTQKPKVWVQYINDIFFIRQHGKAKLEEFIMKYSHFHETIKFTAEY